MIINFSLQKQNLRYFPLLIILIIFNNFNINFISQDKNKSKSFKMNGQIINFVAD